MNSLVILQQMCVIAILVVIGIYLQRTDILDESGSKKLSVILMNFSNPAVVVSSIINGNMTATHADLLKALVVAVVFYAVLSVVGFLLPRFMPIEKKERKFYNLMVVYTNIGFLGIPLAKVILTENAILYIVICMIMYNLLFYTHGVTLLGGSGGLKLSKFFSPGTVLSLAAILIFWFDISLPAILGNTITYVGNSTTFISMILLGAAVGRSSIAKCIRNKNYWIYTVIRMILMPIALTMILKAFRLPVEMIQAFCLAAALPVGNLPLIQAEIVGEDTEILSQGIIFTTVLCLFSITVLMSVLF